MTREIFGNTEIFGFYTNKGTVTASENWGSQSQNYTLNETITNSYEYYFNKLCIKNNINSFFINLRNIEQNKNTYNFQVYNNFPMRIRTLNNLNKITSKLDLNSQILNNYIPIGSEFIVVQRSFINNNISRLQLSNGSWITEYISYGNINKYCEPVNSISVQNTKDFFNDYKLQRWIGVNYKKDTELNSHYGETCMIKQFDKIIFINQSQALDI